VFSMASWPWSASYDALVGTARLTEPGQGRRTRGGPTIATFLAVLALWRLLRAWRVKAVAVALSVSLAFLMALPTTRLRGLFVTRPGRVRYPALRAGPTLSALPSSRPPSAPSRRTAPALPGWHAAVGLSTSAMFIATRRTRWAAPPLLVTARARRSSAHGAMAAYPLTAERRPRPRQPRPTTAGYGRSTRRRGLVRH
jgi:hypothetical protein